MKSIALILFFITLCEGAPLQGTVENNYFLNYTESSIPIYKRVDQRFVETYLSFESFKFPILEDVTSNFKEFATERIQSLNRYIVSKLKNECAKNKNAFISYWSIDDDVSFVDGLSALYNKTYSISDFYPGWDKYSEPSQHFEEAFILSEIMSIYQLEAFATIYDIFDSNYDWKSFREKFVFPNISESENILEIRDSIVGCHNNSVIIRHQILSGADLEMFKVQDFKVLGTIQDDIYTEPILPVSQFINIDGQWATFDQCPAKDKCSFSYITFPQCSPNNIKKCKTTSEKIEPGFLKFYQHESEIQFVTNIESFSIWPSFDLQTYEFQVPSSGKVTVILEENDTLSIGNEIFYGESKTSTKIIGHKKETKLEENKSRDADWVVVGGLLIIFTVTVFICFLTICTCLVCCRNLYRRCKKI